MAERADLSLAFEQAARTFWPPNRWFVVRSSLIGLGSLACAAVLVLTGLTSWEDAAADVANALIAIGLLQQALDIHIALRRERALSPAARLAWRFAVAWRCVIPPVIAACWVAQRKLDAVFPWSTEGMPIVIQFAIPCLCILIGLSATPWGMPDLRARMFGGWLDYLGGIAGVVLCLICVSQITIIPGLTHVMVRSIELTAPLRFAGHTFQQADPAGDWRHMLYFTLVSSLCLAVVTVGTWLLTLRLPTTARGSVHTARLFGLGACAAAGSACVIWMRMFGLQVVSPRLAESDIDSTWPSRLFTGVLLVFFVLAAAYRLHIVREEDAEEPPLAWRRRQSYVNESRFVPALLLAPFSWSVISCPTEAVWLVAMPQMYGYLAVVWMCVRGLAGLRNARGEEALQKSIRVSIRELSATVAAILALTVCAAEAAAWCVFSLSLFPW